MAPITVEGYAVCASHAHMVDALDFLQRIVEGGHAQAVTIREVHDARYMCACGKPAFWLLRAVTFEQGVLVEVTL